jgi:hypothetical protein
MDRGVALIDVDHTLLFDERLNTTLLDSLKGKDISDVFLFTDTTLTKSEMKKHTTLEKMLKESGFTVHAVLSTLDLVWNKIPAEEAKLFQDYIFSPNYKISAEDNLNLFLKNKIEQIKIEFVSNSQDRSTNGIAYREGKKAYLAYLLTNNKNEPMPNHVIERSMVAKVLGDHIAYAEGYSHTKGLLLDAFMQNKPNWVSHIIIADDNAKVIKSIDQYKEKHKPELLISTIHITHANLNKTAVEHVLKGKSTRKLMGKHSGGYVFSGALSLQDVPKIAIR